MTHCLICSSSNHEPMQEVDSYQLLRCVRCGSIWVDPQPSIQQCLEHHRNSFRGYYGCGIEDFYRYKGPTFSQEVKLKRNRLSLVQKFCEGGGERRLLDIGTGQGLFPLLARQLGWEAYCTEINEEEVSFLARIKGLKCWSANLTELSLPSDFFDIVTMWHVLEHTLNPLETLQEIRRILRPGGFCVVAVPNVASPRSQLRLKLKRPLFSPSFHEWHLFHFSPETLVRVLKMAGVDPIKVMPDFSLFPSSCNSMRRLINQALLSTLDALLPVSRKGGIVAAASKT